jgi:hypothetical protein
VGKLREQDHWGDPGVDGGITLGFGVMDWIELAQNRYRWWALVNAVMNILVQKMKGIS